MSESVVVTYDAIDHGPWLDHVREALDGADHPAWTSTGHTSTRWVPVGARMGARREPDGPSIAEAMTDLFGAFRHWGEDPVIRGAMTDLASVMARVSIGEDDDEWEPLDWATVAPEAAQDVPGTD